MPAYDRSELASRDPDRLIALLVRDEDRAPRAVIEECASREEAMVESLARLLDEDRFWGERASNGEWWLRLHAVMILGLVGSERAGALLVAFMRRIEHAQDDNLQDWLVEFWPALFRNKPDTVVPALRELARDRAVDWYMRIQALDSAIAMAERDGHEALERALDWAAGIAADEAEDWDLRVVIGSTLLDFPRARHRPLLEGLARRQSHPMVSFSVEDVAEAFRALEDKPAWRARNDDPWAFYEPSAIVARQERWEREAMEGDDADDEEDEGVEEEAPMPYVRQTPKVGRNDPCPCGSGKKYKKCCLPELQG